MKLNLIAAGGIVSSRLISRLLFVAFALLISFAEPAEVASKSSGDRACGAASNTPASSAPSADLCSDGTISSVSGSGPWTWSCTGRNRGAAAQCSAPSLVKNPTPVDGACGAANDTIVSNAPATRLCSAGAASSVTGTGPWVWSCAGINGASSVSCSASLEKTQASETLSGDTNRPNNSTFVLGETVQLTFQISGMAASQTTLLTIKVSDETGRVIATLPVSVTGNSRGSETATVTAPADHLGYFRVDAALADGTTLTSLGTRPAGFITYAVVPDPSTRVDYGDVGSRFGLQGGFGVKQGSVIPYLGVRYVLSSAGSWATLESSYSGQFAASRSAALAAGMVYPPKSTVTDNATYNGAAWSTYPLTTVTVAKLPIWAIDPSTVGTICAGFSALNDAGVAGFPGFAQALATEVAADYTNQSSHYYQVTWEPEYNWCFGGTPQQLVQMYQLVYSAIHKADPKAIVAGPTLFPRNITQLSNLWSAGLGEYVDALTMHPYVAWPPETHGLIANIRTQMQMAQNAVGHGIPFVGTEHGYTSGSIGELNEALGDIRETIIILGEGFKFDFDFYIADFWDINSSETTHTYGLYWNLNQYIDYGTDKMGPKPAVPAYAAMTFLLDGTTTSGQLPNLSGTQMGYRFQRNSTTILALWDYQAPSSTTNIAVPAEAVTICDWMGNCVNAMSSTGSVNITLGASPKYVVGQGL